MGDPQRTYFASNAALGIAIAARGGDEGAQAPTSGLTQAAADMRYRRLTVDVPQADIDGFDAAVNALVLAQARQGNTDRWGKDKLPTDTLYGSISGVGDRLPAAGAGLLVNDYFLLRRGYTEGTPPNTTDFTPGVYRRTSTGWFQVAGPATTILSQADVDARVVFGTRAPARRGNTSRWPLNKLNGYPTAVTLAYSRPADNRSISERVTVAIQGTASVTDLETLPIAREAVMGNTDRWAKSKLPADTQYGTATINGVGDRLPATGLINDRFLLRRGYDVGIPPNTTAIIPGLYRRTATGWVVDVNPIALSGNTSRWPKSKLPSDTAYTGSIAGVGDRLPASGLLVNDFFLLRRGYTIGTPPNTTNFTPGVYRRTGTGWDQVIGPTTSVGGLTQAQVDARVVAGTLAQARAGNTARWPATKLTGYPTSVTPAWTRTSSNRILSLRTTIALQGLTSVSGQAIVPIRREAITSNTDRWDKNKLPSDTAYGVLATGDRLPTTSLLVNDFFLLRRGFIEGTPPNTTDRTPGLYRRLTSGWTQVIGPLTTIGGAALGGVGTAFPTSPMGNDYFLLWRGFTTGAVPSTASPATITIGDSLTAYGWRNFGTRIGSISRTPFNNIFDGIFWVSSTRRYEVSFTNRIPVSLRQQNIGTLTIDGTNYALTAGTSFTATTAQQSSSTWDDTPRPSPAVQVTLTTAAATALGLPAGQTAVFTTGGTAGTTTDAGLYQRNAANSAWALATTGGGTTMPTTVVGVGDTLPTTGLLINDFFLLRRGYTEGTPPNTTDRTPGLYRRTSTGWTQVISPTTAVSGLTQAQVDARIIAQARTGNTTRWPKSKLPTDTQYGTGTTGSGGTPTSVTLSTVRSPMVNTRTLALGISISRQGLTSISSGNVTLPIRQQALTGNTARWALDKLAQNIVTGGSISGSTLTLTRNGGTNVALTLPSGGGTATNNYVTGITPSFVPRTVASVANRALQLRISATRQGLGGLLGSVDVPVAREAISGNMDRWPANKIPSLAFIYANRHTLAASRNPQNDILTLTSTIGRAGAADLPGAAAALPLWAQSISGNTTRWPLTKMTGYPTGISMTYAASTNTLTISITREGTGTIRASEVLA